MDYKYIEQLLERYWQCRTTLEEEQILQAFFRQKDVPAELGKYAALFGCREQMKREETLGDDFDERLMAIVDDGGRDVKARTITLRRRLMPLFKAAAVVAIVVTLGNAAQLSFSGKQDAPAGDEINYAGYKDTYNDPAMAYDRMHNALELVSEGFSRAQAGDSARAEMPAAGDAQNKGKR